jgi:hypothetical protein
MPRWKALDNGAARWNALIYCAALLPLVPLLLGLAQELIQPLAWGPPGGDFAVMELHLHDVARLRHWLGPYSRYGWNHPGPLYYYALSPLYWLTGAASTSLYASAAALNLIAAAGGVALFFRERPALRDRLLFALAFGAIVLDFATRRLPSDPWNPIVTVLPLALLWVACVSIACARLRLLPLGVFLHAFVVQTHISHAPCATALLGTAAVLGCARSKRAPCPRPELSSALLLGAGTLLLCWTPSAIAELVQEKSNLAKILQYFLGAKTRVAPVTFALSHGSAELQAIPLRVLHLDDGAASAVASALAWLQASLLVAGLWVARANKRDFALSGCALSLVATAVCYWSCRHLGIVSRQHDYLTLWFPVVSTFGWLSVALALLPSTGHSKWPASKQLWLIALALPLLGLGAVNTSRSLAARYQRLASRDNGAGKRLEAATERIESLVGLAPHGYVLRTGQGKPWSALAGVVLGLRKRGLSPLVHERWRFMLGNGVDYSRPGADRTSLTFTRQLLHDEPLFDQIGTKSFLYVAPQIENVPAHVEVGALGHSGDPHTVLDGLVPSAGADPGQQLELHDTSSSLSVALPGLHIGELEAVVDSGDAYVVEASEDGVSYDRVADIPPLVQPGFGARRVVLPRTGPWRGLRLIPSSPEGRHAVAELRLDTTRWGLTVASAAGATRASGAADGRSPPAGASASSARAAVLAPKGSSLTFELPSMMRQDAHIEGLLIHADADDEYAVGGSYDARTFTPIGTVSKVRGKGQRPRSFYFNDGRDWRFVRLSPARGDKRFSIAEVAPLVARGRLLDFARELADATATGAPAPAAVVATPNERRHVRLSLPAARDHRLGIVTHALPGASQSTLGVCLNGEWLIDIEVTGQRMTHGLGLPGRLVQAENDLELVSSSRDENGAPSMTGGFQLDALWAQPLAHDSSSAAAAPAGRSPCTSPSLLRRSSGDG